MGDMGKLFALLGAVFAGSAVFLGAFGAHALKGKLSPEALSTFEIGVRYQMYHGLALFPVAWLSAHYSLNLFAISGWLMVAGIIFFSFSLYLLSLTSIKIFGAVTPIGGLLFLFSWILLAVGLWRIS